MWGYGRSSFLEYGALRFERKAKKLSCEVCCFFSGLNGFVFCCVLGKLLDILGELAVDIVNKDEIQVRSGAPPAQAAENMPKVNLVNQRA